MSQTFQAEPPWRGRTVLAAESTARRLSNLSSFMYQLPGCPAAAAAGGQTLVPPHRNPGGIILSELFILHEGDIF